jgi:signal peptidase I
VEEEIVDTEAAAIETVETDEEKTTSEAGKEDTEKRPMWREIVSWVLVVVVAMAVAFVMNRYIIVNAVVPSGSMENTIMTGDRVIGWRFAYTFSEPQRGDIVIFKFPDDESENYIKRIIGLPGETVRIENGKIYINDSTEPLEEDYVKEDWYNGDGVYEVPEDCYFMMGDNRTNSNDSRFWENKYVNIDKILGKAVFCYWPFSEFGTLD